MTDKNSAGSSKDGLREGPYVQRECIGCKHLGAQSYRVQGDSGIDYWCNHPSRKDTDRNIGDTSCKTPEWCPFLRPAPETNPAPTEDRFSACYDAFSIGSAVRSPRVLLANIENSSRRSNCLSAIEREFFTYVVKDENGEDMERCDLSWGADPEEYIELFRAALAAKPETIVAPPAGETVLPGRLGHSTWCQHRIDVERLQGLPARPCNCGATLKAVAPPEASIVKAFAQSPRREWNFDRYRNGRLMAEGVRVHAATEAEAWEKAESLKRQFQSPSDELRLSQNGNPQA